MDSTTEDFSDVIRDRDAVPVPKGSGSGNALTEAGFEEGRKFERKVIITLLNTRGHARAGYALTQYFKEEGIEVGGKFA